MSPSCTNLSPSQILILWFSPISPPPSTNRSQIPPPSTNPFFPKILPPSPHFPLTLNAHLSANHYLPLYILQHTHPSSTNSFPHQNTPSQHKSSSLPSTNPLPHSSPSAEFWGISRYAHINIFANQHFFFFLLLNNGQANAGRGVKIVTKLITVSYWMSTMYYWLVVQYVLEILACPAACIMSMSAFSLVEGLVTINKTNRPESQRPTKHPLQILLIQSIHLFYIHLTRKRIKIFCLYWLMAGGCSAH